MTAPVTTIDFPAEIPAVRRGDHWIARAGEVELRLSNLTKVFWPETGYTKGDLLTYYYNVSLTMLPHVEGRPLTLKRMPEGIVGLYFYEKDAPSYTPEWMPTLDVEADTEDRTIHALTITDVASLLWVVNLGCIDIHPLHARGRDQTHPSYAVFDLDPFPPAGLREVKQVATVLRSLLERFGLASYPKTSGATGLQVYVPLDGSHTFGEVRDTVTRLCELIHRADPETTTMEWDIARRAGRVFLDAKMNRRWASLAAAYSVRPGWDAPVSMPFAWDELDELDPAGFTVNTALARVAKVGDVFAPVAQPSSQSLHDVMDEIGVRRGD